MRIYFLKVLGKQIQHLLSIVHNMDSIYSFSSLRYSKIRRRRKNKNKQITAETFLLSFDFNSCTITSFDPCWFSSQLMIIQFWMTIMSSLVMLNKNLFIYLIPKDCIINGKSLAFRYHEIQAKKVSELWKKLTSK